VTELAMSRGMVLCLLFQCTVYIPTATDETLFLVDIKQKHSEAWSPVSIVTK